MHMRASRSPWVFALVLLTALVASVSPLAADSDPSKTKSPRPKLVVLLVFDQFRGDYLSRWHDLFGRGGFRRLMENGAWYQNCHYPYAITVTGAGHASLSTGQTPSEHGIVSNSWYDREKQGFVYCVQEGIQGKGPIDLTKITPKYLETKTIGDVLHAARPASKVVALSLKDRAAVLLAGKEKSHFCSWHIADAPVAAQKEWLGKFFLEDRQHTSPDWLRAIDAGSHWKNDDHWKPCYGEQQLLYERRCTVIKDVDEPRFDHFIRPSGSPDQIATADSDTVKKYYKALQFSPFGNDLLLEAIKLTIERGHLSPTDPNLLLVSFSSNDLVGHVWGPDSPEVLDVTLRTDELISELLRYLDEKVGENQYLMCVTADHGVCPRPGVARAQGRLNPKRLKPTDLLDRAAQYLRGQYPDKAPANPIVGLENLDSRAAWDKEFESWIFLHKDWGDAMEDAGDKLAAWLRNDPDVWAAYSVRQLDAEQRQALRGRPPSDSVLRQAALSYFRKRCGDVIVIPRPYCFFNAPVISERRQKPGDLAYTTTHGTPHSYDTHVPLLVYGPGVRPGPRKDRTSPLATAAILAHALGVKMPDGAEPCPDGLFEP
jgi:arylsulfatase A-like enzyme